MERTLVLSAGYEPLSTTNWQKAVCLLTLGKAEVVEEYDREIRSTNLVLKMPAVVRLVNVFRRHKRPVKFSKTNVFARDRFRCQYCGGTFPIAELTRDHVLPRAQGGTTVWENVTTACRECNHKKANRTPQQAGMRLRTQPRKPDWVPVFSLQVRRAPTMWEPYMRR